MEFLICTVEWEGPFPAQAQEQSLSCIHIPAEQTSQLSLVTFSDETLTLGETLLTVTPLTIYKVYLILREEPPPIPPLNAGSVWYPLELVLRPVNHLSTMGEHRD